MAKGTPVNTRGRSRSPARLSPMEITVSTNSVERALKQLDEGVRNRVLRSAAHAGALVFYNAMKLKVPFRSGTLYESIYRWHDFKRSTATRQMYAIGPNKQKAPHWHWVEYGNIRMQKQPFIRPTWHGYKDAALRAMRERARERVREIIQEMAL